ncbi:transmembrane protein, putative (macronuclear) [Tetrahymena thermophila SB210]|uniref:Transmembrane protein, putative n=1 Tax=Tetrahymena thermophila (strain SB210) TaxID=312017 RepID=Q22L47_TETTS|nr:transmembrane protein, putative [Tetrahymena thermophila SB210]EAR85970.1 transmembrane protein, putative [Tetrahymena thermophila SB210]|eukprot:XP_976565.1 transmembrane protein, putative [Tetrahymena thermophila SB210]
MQISFIQKFIINQIIIKKQFLKQKKFTAICLIALLALTSVKADANTDVANCIQNLPKPCASGAGAQDDTCPRAYIAYGACISQNCASKAQNLSDYASCLKSSCKSDNANVQKYIDGQISCIYGSLLSLTTLILAAFALFF